jgi:hypothetical protein
LYDRPVMPTPTRSPVQDVVERYAGRLKAPWLFAAVLILFLADLVIPDPIPFVDEVLLALLTFLVGTWRTRRKVPTEAADVIPSTTGDAGTRSDGNE